MKSDGPISTADKESGILRGFKNWNLAILLPGICKMLYLTNILLGKCGNKSMLCNFHLKTGTFVQVSRCESTPTQPSDCRTPYTGHKALRRQRASADLSIRATLKKIKTLVITMS